MEIGGATRPMILVTLDGSHFSEAILGTVKALAVPLGADVELFTVGRLSAALDTPVARTYGEMTPTATASGTRIGVPLPSAQSSVRVETREQALGRIGTELRQYLTDRSQELTGTRVSIAVDINDDPARAIITYARRVHPTLIAMTTHGRTGLGHLLAGSVCEAVIRSGVAPVLVLRP